VKLREWTGQNYRDVRTFEGLGKKRYIIAPVELAIPEFSDYREVSRELRPPREDGSRFYLISYRRFR